MIGSADVAKAINTVWTNAGLEAQFTSYWSAADRDDFPALHDQEAGPSQPFPYCVFELGGFDVAGRMSGRTGSSRFQTHDFPLTFHIHAKQVTPTSAKEVAESLMELMVREYGGHPTLTPRFDMTLDNGAVLVAQLLSDYGVREGDEEYKWILRYNVRVDVPVAA